MSRQYKQNRRRAATRAPILSARGLGVAAVIAGALAIGVAIGASLVGSEQTPRRTESVRAPVAAAVAPSAVVASKPVQTHAPRAELAPPATPYAPPPAPAASAPAAPPAAALPGRIGELPPEAPPPLLDGRSSGGETALPPWRRFAALAPETEGRPMVALVIDDMGVDRKRSRRAARLPAQVTLAYLPYADGVAQLVEEARRIGHEILVHLPMEATDRGAYPGPNALMVDLDGAELMRRLRWNLDRFSGYVGVNNHMGSRFTASTPAMDMVLQELRARGLLFLDSRTGSDSVAGRSARRIGMPTASRDIFLDHIETAENVASQLQQVEETARRQGHAIAIGHPHDTTLDQLERWLPMLGQKGLILVPLSAVVARGYQG